MKNVYRKIPVVAGINRTLCYLKVSSDMLKKIQETKIIKADVRFDTKDGERIILPLTYVRMWK